MANRQTIAPGASQRNPAPAAEVGRARNLPTGEVGPDTFLPEAIASKKKGRYGTQNLIVVALQVLGWAGCLTAIEHAPVWLAVLLTFAFCMLMQGVFSMMHEYFHDNAHPDRRVGYAIGIIGATLFGTSATLHRVNHWGHHVRNRTPAEQGEFIHEGESALGKVALYYFAITVGLWLSGLVFPVLALFIPFRAVAWLSAHRRYNTYSAAFSQFKARDWTRMRIEALGLIAFWTLVVMFGPWSATTLVVSYACFAFSWSSLQWVYHLRTPLHVVEGAYNLRLPLVLRWAWLSFNMNLTHHRRPYLPWQELAAASDMRETQPMWYRWGLMFKPPVRFPDDLSSLEKRYF